MRVRIKDYTIEIRSEKFIQKTNFKIELLELCLTSGSVPTFLEKFTSRSTVILSETYDLTERIYLKNPSS